MPFSGSGERSRARHDSHDLELLRVQGLLHGQGLGDIPVHQAVALGADQIILGTIFETACKKGLRGKGLSFVSEICSACPLPVYAIGGIKESNIEAVIAAGARGGCMMSGYMKYSGAESEA